MRDIANPNDRLGDVVGFGWTPEGLGWREQERKYTFQSSWISEEQCVEELGARAEVLSRFHFCAKDFFGVASVCHGDHGAGFVMYIDSLYYLTGVLSVFTNMCQPNYPAMYTRVALYSAWIDAVVGGSY